MPKGGRRQTGAAGPTASEGTPPLEQLAEEARLRDRTLGPHPEANETPPRPIAEFVADTLNDREIRFLETFGGRGIVGDARGIVRRRAGTGLTRPGRETVLGVHSEGLIRPTDVYFAGARPIWELTPRGLAVYQVVRDRAFAAGRNPGIR